VEVAQDLKCSIPFTEDRITGKPEVSTSIDAFRAMHALSEVALFRNALCGRRRLQGLCPRTPRIYRLVPLPMLGSLQETDEKGGCRSIPPYRSVEATESALGLLPSIALSSAQFGLILLRRDKEAHLCGGF
jgi:hypothetical protein